MTASTASCLHCLTPLASNEGGETFCCTGCGFVYGLLHTEKLDRYYDLRGGRGRAVADTDPGRRDRKWLELLADRLAAEPGIGRIDLDVQGLHCSGCVWLLRELFGRHPGGRSILVNPAIGRLHVTADATFDLTAFVWDVERFGYLLGPPLKSDRRASQGLVARMGVCVAIAMNSMIFAIAIYAGLDSGPLFDLFQRLNLVLSFVSLVVGGSVFIGAAWRGVRRGVLHLDLPIALGILLAFAGSVHSYFARRGDATFVDTLNVFIALMLVGRWLQQRVLEGNRLALLESDGVTGLLTRTLADGRVAIVKCTALRAGDTILLAPGDLLPVDAMTRGEAMFSLDWINGESQPRVFAAGTRAPAGAFFAGDASIEVVAVTAFAESSLVELLRTPVARDSDASAKASWWQRFSKLYVGAVLALAVIGFVLWMLVTRDPVRAVEIATAVLIVTCPCAFGIAMPLATDLACAGLRRAGLFVRAPGFLERAARVRTVVFDKTGTVTTGALAVANPEVIAGLTAPDRGALYALAARSHHPKSLAVRRALEQNSDASYELGVVVTEHPGKGVVLRDGEHEYRLGGADWAADGACDGDVAFAKDRLLLAAFRTVEVRRADAVSEIAELRRAGYDVWLLSGDAQARVSETARACGVAEAHAIGDQSPSEKAAWLGAHDRGDILMIGDGINDSLAVEKAFCSGTPAIDRPFMAARSDFYFVSAGLSPIRLALRASRALNRVRTRNLCIAVAYNAVAITLAYAGLMSPLVCAVFMPASSLTTIATTALSLNARSRTWRS